MHKHEEHDDDRQLYRAGDEPADQPATEAPRAVSPVPRYDRPDTRTDESVYAADADADADERRTDDPPITRYGGAYGVYGAPARPPGFRCDDADSRCDTDGHELEE